MSKRRVTIGSLFSGSGGFELAGAMFGAVPVWASEIEPFPIAVTRKRFPEMIHMGDIGQLDGAELPPVDIITGGSPCQDMSVAGKREGLDGARSGLFREQIRIIREMRQKHGKPQGVIHLLFCTYWGSSTKGLEKLYKWRIDIQLVKLRELSQKHRLQIVIRRHQLCCQIRFSFLEKHKLRHLQQ